ncbi:MAG: peptide MFS transporter, partial [Pseudomonadales bacterium]
MLFITEMWERFSYYGMRALLVLYLIASTDQELASGQANTNPGFGWSDESAYLLYGIYTWAVYLTPIFGGMMADKLLGTHRSMLIGGWIIAAGHITLAATELFGVSAGEVVTLQTGPGALLCFVTGLTLIVVGTGFFKPCASVMVGQLYGDNDPRRDAGFTIFYMGINIGAFGAPFIAGTLGETVGWHWGFGSAAVGMIAGILFYQFMRNKYLPGVGLPPDRTSRSASQNKDRRPPLSSVEWHRIVVILILAFVGNIAFWTAFEQAGSSMNVFAAQSTDRTLWGWLDSPFPATWYQAANPAAVIIFAPVFAWLWVILSRRGLEP